MTRLHQRWTAAVLVMATTAGAAALAQQQNQPQRTPNGRAAQPAARGTGSLEKKWDEHVASCLILENDGEIAAAKIAEQKAKSDDVKQFARTMEKDHQQFVSELEKLSGDELRNRRAQTGATTGTGTRNENNTTRNENANAREPRNEGRTNANNNAAGGAPRANPAQRNDQDPYAALLQIKEEMADQCQASVRRELDSKKGEEFDACYMGMQIAAHMHMIDSLTVLERHVSPELRPVLQKGLKVSQQHFEEAKKIMKNVTHTQTASNEKSAK